MGLPTEREAERLTGLQAGGISPLALLNRGFQVVLDESAQEHAEIYISGGQRGLDIRLPVPALLQPSPTPGWQRLLAHSITADNSSRDTKRLPKQAFTL